MQCGCMQGSLILEGAAMCLMSKVRLLQKFHLSPAFCRHGQTICNVTTLRLA